MPRLNTLLAALVLTGALAMLAPVTADAQSTAAKILEKARGQAREIEELRKILNGPDQNMRLATFDAMVKSGDEALRLIAYETGLASADSVMRVMAFKALLMSFDKLHLTLTPDPSAPKKLQEVSAAHIAERGNGFIVYLQGKNIEAGTYNGRGSGGQISGLEFVFTESHNADAGSMSLRDDNALAGVVRLNHGRTQFLATARLR